ncbi:MAG: glycerophosphodiester phosphodiesterase [Bacteroidota bacterium]
MRLLSRILGLAFILLMSLNSNAQKKIDLQGHRGARGLKPENTIPAFIRALDHGVTTLELDVVITKDKKVVVSHEPYLSHVICRNPEGNKYIEEDEKRYNMYKMTYEEIVQFDCGTVKNPRFPDQELEKTPKPLLSDVIKSAERYIKSYTQYEVDYNIELKSTPSGDGEEHPSPEEFSDLVYELINQYLPMERVVIQCFDFRVLKYWHKKYPKVRLAALVENSQSIDTNLSNLGFKPEIYSPYYKLLNRKKIRYLQSKGIKVIPWTVNDPKQMEKLVAMNIDGIITDFPDRAQELGLTLFKKDEQSKN